MDISTAANVVATIITAFATAAIACLTKKLIDENRRLIEITEDKPSLLITKRGTTLIITNLSKNPVAIHAILLSYSCDRKKYIEFWKNRNYWLNKAIILPPAGILENILETRSNGITLKDSKLFYPHPNRELSCPIYTITLTHFIQNPTDAEVKKDRRCIGVVFSYTQTNKPYMFLAEFESSKAFPKEIQKIILD